MKKIFFLCLAMFVMCALKAQTFDFTSHSYSGSKTTYVTLADGSKVEGTIHTLKRKKGIAKSLKLRNTVSGKTEKYSADQIGNMYAMPSGLDKLNNSTKYVTNVRHWGSSNINSDILSKGYTYLENTDVYIKKNKKRTLLMQMINPSFSSKIAVYADPLAKETGFSVGGLNVTGGIDKTYYIKKAGDATARKVSKGSYKDEFRQLFADCPALIAKYGDKISWNDFPKHVYEYTAEACK